MNLILRSVLVLIVVAMSLTACKQETSPALKDAFLNVIPKPVKAELAESGAFTVDNATMLYVEGEDLEVVARHTTDLTRVTKVSDDPKNLNQIDLRIVNDSELGDEGYELTIEEKKITIAANKPAGIFYGLTTLDQISVKDPSTEALSFATGKIRDYPTFGWRGSMLDVARHFFSVEDVKRYIDMIAAYKMNVLHLGLSNDQGWRIEIKSWPKLTEIGSKTQVGGGGGGFYTQEQYKDIVAYAQSRYVNIIPEIDMPSHTEAALASYPELSCDGRKPALYEGTEVGFNSFCPKNDKLINQFVGDVIREITSITPGPYFHIGGDEASKAVKKDDYIRFIKNFKQIVQANKKYLIGWEEVAQSDIGPGDLVQYWHNAKHADTAVRKGAKLIMSPSTKVYLDMKYDSTIKHIGYDWAALIEVDDSYLWNIEDMIPGVTLENVVGVEAPLWSETLKSMKDIEFMLFPRLPGIAEIGWHYDGRDWNEYKGRLAKHAKFMDEWGINYYKSPKIDWTNQPAVPSPQ
ncbi:MAG TPA: beta-N-acetylhexosaminidase [Cyclobacteriaceae bacterium]|nr:beta-N-acetylhexosaminidase [Cyclobacteriaceae bacterium]